MAARVRYAVSSFADLFGGTNTSSGVSLAGGNVAVTGNYIIVKFLTQNTFRTVSSIADTAGTTFTQAGTAVQDGAGTAAIYYGTVAANSAGQNVVVTMSGNLTDSSLIEVYEVSGLDASQASISVNGQANNATQTHVTGNVTPANANGIIVCNMLRSNASWTDDATFTEETTGSDNAYSSYYLNAPAAAIQVSNTSDINRNSVSKIVAFVGASAGGGVKTLTLLGVG